MSDPPSTQSSSSDQLAAFSPNTVEASSQRTPVVFPGMSTLRSADPFGGWPQGIFSPGMSAPGTGLSHSRGASTSALPAPAFSIPPPSQYSPAQTQHSFARTQHSSQPLYSPSHVGRSVYSPSPVDLPSPLNPDFLARLLAASADQPAGLDPVSSFPRNTSAPSQGLAHILNDLPSPVLPSLATDNQRGFIVNGVPTNSTHWSVLEHFLPGDYPSIDSVYLRDLQTQGRFSVLFADLRDVTRSIHRLRYIHPEWVVDPASAQDIANLTNEFDIPSTSNTNDGILMVTVRANGNCLTEDYHDLVERLVRSLGDVRLFRLSENGSVAQKYRVEFYSTRHTSYAFACLQGFKYEYLTFHASFNRPQDDTNRGLRPRTPSVSSQHVPLTPDFVSSSSDTSPSKESSNGENTIDMDLIHRGMDVRSTIMIRNIPNKITSDELKNILDESSFGKYDFLYLRMDFNHGCNVGYAFVNFGDAIDIVDLMLARQGKTWPDCLSEKKAEISYATLQGKDVLVAKFRNSNVMTRPANERPRLFHIGGPRSGTEAQFPPPNDASKLRRSVASTTQQGLFAPRARDVATPVSGSRSRPRARAQSFSQNPRSRPFLRTPRGSVGQAMLNSDDVFSSPMQLDDDRSIKTEDE
ncbi:hypothetical protein N7499_008586 [Penicillium canescens]|nr:hypothetical protein N7522_012332 [Penicillium canescens]KAJ6076605.1 hypothetical protein N7499_008586 [Penicillium canescens]KAJ6158913.1 hypothetical protein N7485_011739 [Penicillium canescens]